MENIQDEAILEILSEINKKADMSIGLEKSIQKSLNNSESLTSISKEEIESIVQNQEQKVVNHIDDRHNKEVTKLDALDKSINALSLKLERIPIPKEISLAPIIELFPKQKKVTIMGFEFLRSSIVIFALALLSFCSLTVNIRQADYYQILKYRYSEQTEYIRQIQIEKQKSETKVPVSNKKKKR